MNPEVTKNPSVENPELQGANQNQDMNDQAEKKEKGRFNEAFRMMLGKRAVDLFEYYGSDEEQKLREEIEVSKREQKEKEEQLAKIETERIERQQALQKGYAGITGYYNKYPDRIGEIVVPGMKHDAEYYREKFQKEVEENGKASYGEAVQDYLRTQELLNREDLKNLTEKEIAEEESLLRQEQESIYNSADLGEMSEKEIDEKADAVNEKLKAFMKKKKEFLEYQAMIERAEDADVEAEDESVAAAEGMPAEDLEVADWDADEMTSDFTAAPEETEESTSVFDAVKHDSMDKAQAEKFKNLRNDLNAKFDELEENANKRIEEIEKEAKDCLAKLSEKMKEESAEKITKKKEKKIVSITRKLKEKGYKLALVAAMTITLLPTLSGCTKNLETANYSQNAIVSESNSIFEEIGGEEVGDASIIQNQEKADEAQNTQAVGNENEAGAEAQEVIETPSFMADYYSIGDNEERHDLHDELYRDVDFSVANPFTAEVKAKGEAKTVDKKEAKGSFGTTLTPAWLEGDLDGAEQEFNSNLMSRAANQPQLLVSLLAASGAAESLKDVEFNTGRSGIDGTIKLETAQGDISNEAINRDAQRIAKLPQPEQQKIMDALSEARQNKLADKEYEMTTVSGKYVTQCMREVTDDKGNKSYEVVIVEASRSKPFAAEVVKDDAEKLRVLKELDRVSSDTTLEDAQARKLLDKWTVFLKSDCGGQYGAKAKVTKKKSVTPPTTQTVVPQQNPLLTWAVPTTTIVPGNPIIPGSPIIPGNPVPNVPDKPNPGPGPGPGPSPTPELAPKTDENHQGNDADPNTGVSPSEGTEIVKQGEEQVPEENHDNVQETPTEENAEPPSAPQEDTNTGGEENQSPSDDQGAADEFNKRTSGGGGGSGSGS